MLRTASLFGVAALRVSIRRMARGMSDDIHVMPVGDLREHEDSADCWCRPRRDEEEPRVMIHNSMDQRELHETGKRLTQ